MVFPMLLSGCMDCLQAGAFTFDHDTELGFLEKEGFTRDFIQYEAPPPDFVPDACAELMKTPPFSAWQEALWLVHCKDFMRYKGIWTKADFIAANPQDPKKVFAEMTHMARYTEPAEAIWERLIADPTTSDQRWDISYYVFECPHCGKKRGYFDFP